MAEGKPTFYEFFAGAGMARAGLGPAWRCLFANDFDRKKGETYAANWGDGEIVVEDVRKLRVEDMPGAPDLVWGSFPCQDLSLAGGGAGLRGERSGTFYPFWDHMTALVRDGRAPAIIALENVCGTLTSHGGADFQAICRTFAEAGYRYGAVVIDASLFVPQSRPRLFVIGVHGDLEPTPAALADGPGPWHSRQLRLAHERLPEDLQAGWLWWDFPGPARRNTSFADIIEDEPVGVAWHTPEETRALLAKMSPVNLAKVEAARKSGHRMVGGVYKRTRHDETGAKVQRAEVRFDDVAGCLRTPAGGSSRQTILIVEGKKVRSRLISPRETARLMGMDEGYKLPRNYNEAYHLTGDGVAVPVVRHLAEHVFEPIIAGTRAGNRRAA